MGPYFSILATLEIQSYRTLMVKILKIMCRIQIKNLSISTKVTTFGYQSNKMEGNMVVPWYFGAFFFCIGKACGGFDTLIYNKLISP